MDEPLHIIKNKWGDGLFIFENGIHLKASGLSLFDSRWVIASAEQYVFSIDRFIGFDELASILPVKGFFGTSRLMFGIKGAILESSKATMEFKDRGKAERVKKLIEDTKKYDMPFYLRQKAISYEKYFDYDSAIEIWNRLGKPEEAARVRRMKAEQGAVKVSQNVQGDQISAQNVVYGDQITAQKVVQGDEIKRTDIRDSVVSRSNVGGGGEDKFTKLKELTVMKEKGLIDDAEFKQMKKEILGK